MLTFLTIGLLLWIYYQVHPDPTLPKTPNEIFCHFILYEMPVGIRGLLIAGIFATAMGSLSTALNALATSFTRDWYEPYINPDATTDQSMRAVRWATVWFSILMIVVASTTSYLVIVHPKVRIIPIVLEFSVIPTARSSAFSSAGCSPSDAATISATSSR